MVEMTCVLAITRCNKALFITIIQGTNLRDTLDTKTCGLSFFYNTIYCSPITCVHPPVHFKSPWDHLQHNTMPVFCTQRCGEWQDISVQLRSSWVFSVCAWLNLWMESPWIWRADSAFCKLQSNRIMNPFLLGSHMPFHVLQTLAGKSVWKRQSLWGVSPTLQCWVKEEEEGKTPGRMTPLLINAESLLMLSLAYCYWKNETLY